MQKGKLFHGTMLFGSYELFHVEQFYVGLRERSTRRESVAPIAP
jgi:hypothetical protein